MEATRPSSPSPISRKRAERTDKGELWENSVFRILADKSSVDTIRYWRTSGGNEVDFVYIADMKNNAWGSYKEKNGQSLAQFAEAINTIGKVEKFAVVDLYNEPKLKIETLVKYKRLKDPVTNTYKNYPYPKFIDVPFNPLTDEYPCPAEAIGITYDGLHPSDKGYGIIAEKLIKIMKKY